MILCVAVSVISTSTDVAVTVKIWMKPLTGMKGLRKRVSSLLSTITVEYAEVLYWKVKQAFALNVVHIEVASFKVCSK